MSEVHNQLQQLVEVLFNSGVHVLPIVPGTKRPPFKDWQDVHLKPEQFEYYIKNNYGIGIMPHTDFIFMDIDNDHSEDVQGTKELSKVITPNNLKTLSQTKLEGNNRHLFFKPSPNVSGKWTGDQAILSGVEVSSERSFIRLYPDYQFDTDELLTKGNFYDCLTGFPEELIPYFKPSSIPMPMPNKKRLKGNIDAYLKKVEPFPEGERQSGYRQLIFNMVIKNGMPYNDVVDKVIEWDLKNGDFQDEEPEQFYHAIREVQ